MRMVHVSDMHFGTEVPPVLAALRQRIHSLQPDILILSGDVTQRARRGQFLKAQQFLGELEDVTRLVIPGNHDIPLFNLVARFSHPYRGFLKTVAKERETIIEEDGLLIIGLKTTSRFRHKDGDITEDQMDKVSSLLQQSSPDVLKIVVAHHPFDVVLPQDEENLIHNGEKAVTRWAEAGLDIVMGGHIHYPFAGSLLGRYPSLSRDVFVVQAGTACSSRVRNHRPNSFNTLDWKAGDACYEVRRWDYFEQSQSFEEEDVHVRKRGTDCQAFTS